MLQAKAEPVAGCALSIINHKSVKFGVIHKAATRREQLMNQPIHTQKYVEINTIQSLTCKMRTQK